MKPKFDYKKWVRDTLPKLNSLALKNVQIVNDVDGKTDIPKNGIRLSLISTGEFRRLQELCFPGAVFNSPDSEYEDLPHDRKNRKGIRKDATPASS